MSQVYADMITVAARMHMRYKPIACKSGIGGPTALTEQVREHSAELVRSVCTWPMCMPTGT